jgi:thioredoxin-dependent peroxiredoxin
MRFLFALWVGFCAATLLAGTDQNDPILQAGDLAPDFALPGTDGKVHRLADHIGIRPIVLAWFPRVFITD